MSTPDPIAPTPDGEAVAPNPAPETPAPAAADTVVPPAAPEGETVTIKKTDFDAMTGRQSTLDKQEARINRKLAKLGGGSHFGGQPVQPAPAPAPAPAGDDDGSAEDRKAVDGLRALALKPEFREVLDAEPTLRELFVSNPLALLPIIAPDAFDAEDAIGLVTEELERRAALIKPAPAAPAAPAPVVVPPAGVVNLSDGAVGEEAKEDPEYQAAVKPGTVRGVAHGIAHRLNSRGKGR